MSERARGRSASSKKWIPVGSRENRQCADRPVFLQTNFSIGHRGGGALVPRAHKESHEAGARMGAGFLECDVTFTKDGALVCRHDQYDLHTTTNILVTPLADKCSVPFSPAEFDASGKRTKAASALCCTSDLTLDQFKSLKGKMDASAPTPRRQRVPGWHGELAHGSVCDRRDAPEPQEASSYQIAGAKFTPNSRGLTVAPGCKSRRCSAARRATPRRLIDTTRAESAKDVFARSFNLTDVLYWIKYEPQFGAQAVYLDDAKPCAAELPKPGT